MGARDGSTRRRTVPPVLAHEVARADRMADGFEGRVTDPLMQSAPTMAHLILAVALDVARGFGDLTTGRPRLAAWMRAISELPSMQRTALALLPLN